MKFWLALLFIILGVSLEAHPGMEDQSSLKAIGDWHYVFLHFPIALLTMTVVAEILSIWTKNILYDYASYFMLLSAAFLVVPTVLFGQILGYSISESYVGISAAIYPWHLFFGYTTGALTIVAAWLRVQEGRLGSLYLFFLILAFLFMSVTGLLGGVLSFGMGLSWMSPRVA